jgi:hypothetical protein
MDKNGGSFINAFGIMPLVQDSPIDCLPPTHTSDQESGGYVPRDIKLTNDEFRRGNTFRRPVGDVECQFKFPRTFHIYDTGNIEVDGLLFNKKERNQFLGGALITVEEKVDGANIGISLDPERIGTDGRACIQVPEAVALCLHIIRVSISWTECLGE